MLLTESDSGAPYILLSFVSKSWKSFNPSQLLTDLNQKVHSFRTLDLHDNPKCKWTIGFNSDYTLALLETLPLPPFSSLIYDLQLYLDH